MVSSDGPPGDFWTAVLNQVSFPRRVSAASTQPGCDIPNKANQQLATIPFFRARQFSPTCRIASGRVYTRKITRNEKILQQREVHVPEDRREREGNSRRSSSIFPNRPVEDCRWSVAASVQVSYRV